MARSGGIPPTEAELRQAVAKHIRFLTTSGNLVLQGDTDEAVRVAVSLRVLLHDTPSSHSVLGQLGWKDKLEYVNSLRYIEIAPDLVVSLGTDTGEDIYGGTGLVVLRYDQAGEMRYVAPLDTPPIEGPPPFPATLPFDEWWKSKVLNGVDVAFSRWDLIDAMAHKDGGAHVDPDGLPHHYQEFKLRGVGNLSVPNVSPDPNELPEQLDVSEATYPGDAASPTVVQIAWELLETLTRAGLPDGPAPV